MEYIGVDWQKKQIEIHQKFLLKLLGIHIGNYYPLRKYLGIDHKGKIDEITNLSIAYNTKHFPKNGKWYEQVTRTYQQSDLGYKLNLVLDKIPQLSFALPALLQPAYGLGALAFFFLTQTTYTPPTKDNELSQDKPTTVDPEGADRIDIGYQASITKFFNGIYDLDLTDIPDGAIFSQGDFSIYSIGGNNYNTSRTIHLSRMTRTNWVEADACWNYYTGTTAWTTAGGDYTTTNQTDFVGTTENTKWLLWQSATLIQDCWDNQSKHINVIARQSATTDCYAATRSRSIADTNLRPKLTVTYAINVTATPLAIALTASQQTLAFNFSYLLNTQALTLSQPTPTQNYDYLLGVSAQGLTLSQPTPTQSYDYKLGVLSQGLTIEQPITIIEILSYVYPSVLALSLSQPTPIYHFSYALSSLELNLSQQTPTYNSSYALACLGLLLSQHNPWYFLWSKEVLHTTTWIKEEIHN